jgi:hypothetical protein
MQVGQPTLLLDGALLPYLLKPGLTFEANGVVTVTVTLLAAIEAGEPEAVG